MTKVLHISTRHNVGGISKVVLNSLSDSTFEQFYATGYCEKNEKEYSFKPIKNTYTLYRVKYLKKQISGILNWCNKGLVRFKERDKFKEYDLKKDDVDSLDQTLLNAEISTHHTNDKRVAVQIFELQNTKLSARAES